MKIYDISLEIRTGMPVYPNNSPVKVTPYKRMPKHGSNLSRLDCGTHTGTHVDSQFHVFGGNKPAVDKIPLDKFYGPCVVVDLTKIKFGDGIESKHLKGLNIKKGDVVLFKTKNSKRGFKKFYKDYIYLSEGGAEYLVKKKVKTVGIDSLSIQMYHTGYCASHCVLLKKNIIIFEGLDLSKVPKGRYIFAGLPLKIKDCDGAPARAILIKR